MHPLPAHVLRYRFANMYFISSFDITKNILHYTLGVILCRTVRCGLNAPLSARTLPALYPHLGSPHSFRPCLAAFTNFSMVFCALFVYLLRNVAVTWCITLSKFIYLFSNFFRWYRLLWNGLWMCSEIYGPYVKFGIWIFIITCTFFVLFDVSYLTCELASFLVAQHLIDIVIWAFNELESCFSSFVFFRLFLLSLLMLWSCIPR